MTDYYRRFSPHVLDDLKKLNEDLDKEKISNTPDKNKIAKLYQQIMMRGLEMSAGPMGIINKPYR
jgi:GTP cyclohydrolase I